MPAQRATAQAPTPVIADEAAHLTVFQRTANYSIPARNRPMSADESREIKASYPEIWQKARGATNGHPFDVSSRGALSVSEDEREAIYEAAWARGGFVASGDSAGA